MNPDFEAHSSEQGPDIKELYSFIEVTHKNLLEDNNLVPVFVFHKDGKLNVGILPNELMNSKNLLGKTLSNLVDSVKPDYYWMATEAWASDSKKLEGDDELLWQAMVDGNISEFPRNKRDEDVVLNVTDCRNEQPERWLGIYKIIRDRQEVIHNFSPTRWIKQGNGSELKGRLVI